MLDPDPTVTAGMWIPKMDFPSNIVRFDGDLLWHSKTHSFRLGLGRKAEKSHGLEGAIWSYGYTNRGAPNHLIDLKYRD